MVIFCPSSAFDVTFPSSCGAGWTPLGRLLSKYDFVPVTRITSEFSSPLPFVLSLDWFFLKERKTLTNYSITKTTISQASTINPEETRIKEFVKGCHITRRIGSWGCIWQLSWWNIFETHNCPCAGTYNGVSANTRIGHDFQPTIGIPSRCPQMS